MMKTLLFFGAFICFSVFGQNSGVGINPGGTLPDPTAALDIDFNDKGFLIPRLTTVQRDAIQNPATGLQIYNTTLDCLQSYMPISGWRDIICDCANFPSSNFTFTDSVALNSPATFNIVTTGSNFSWTFDQGSPATSNQQSPSVTWSNAGVYNVTLTVIDNFGCSSTTTYAITIINCPPPVSLNFTNCSQTGNTGPSQNQCNNTYNNTPLNGLVSVTAGIQQWVVPNTGNYLIEAAGAQGGGANNSGRGVVVSGVIHLNQGDVIRILVGQAGGFNPGGSGSGGGGSYVVRNNLPLVVAGGGGGQYTSSSLLHNANAVTSTSGMSTGCGNGGANGNGGTGCPNNNGSSGGGGFSSNGTSGSWGSGGLAFVNGGTGGNTSSNAQCIGGFGGGGGTHGNTGGGGGGGGYSGGGGGFHDNNTGAGGGGGSYIDPTATNVSTTDGQYNNQALFNGSPITNLNTYNSGDGYVNITSVCP